MFKTLALEISPAVHIKPACDAQTFASNDTSRFHSFRFGLCLQARSADGVNTAILTALNKGLRRSEG